MKLLINKMLNIYFYILFLIFTIVEVADIIVIILCAKKTLELSDILYIRGFLGGISIISILLTFFSYLTPLCINNNYPVLKIPDVLREVNFIKPIKLFTNIPLMISTVFSVVLFVIFKPFHNQDEIYEILWMLGLFLPICFKTGIYYLMWSKELNK